MTERERLAQRLFGDPDRQTINFQVFRGDGQCSTEDLCGAINRAMDQRERGEAAVLDRFPDTAVRRDVRDLMREIEI